MRSACYALLLSAVCLVLSACAFFPEFAQRPHTAETSAQPTQVDDTPVAEPVRSTPAESAVEIAPEAPPPATVDASQEDLWERLREGFAIEYQDQSSKVRRRAEWYMRKDHRDGFLDRALKRGQHYLPYILAEVERRKLPTELALLPLVESAYHPYARSHKNAVGLWQFIPSTGRIYGLKRDWWYEGRRDVHAATHAALDYLEQLHKEMDGDWLLALASYNTGARNVQRAISRNRKQGKPTNFWALRLPRETRGYVPNLLAVTELVRRPEHYGLQLDRYPGEAIVQVRLDGPIDLALAAECADIPMDLFYTLNPATRRWMTPPEGPHRLLLPANRVERFHKNLAEVPQSERVRWTVHPIRRNDTLYRVAAHYGLDDTQGLAALNDIGGEIPKGRETLQVPTMMYAEKKYRSSVYKNAFEGSAPEISGQHRFVYRVRKGDSLWLIARRYGTSIKQLRRWNPKSTRGSFLMPGKKLVLWLKDAPDTVAAAPTPTQPTASGRGGTRAYVVRSGDSLWLIAKRFGTTSAALASINELNPRRHLMPGKRLRIPGADHKDTAQKVLRYTVQQGDSLWLIAQRFDTSIRKLLSWNGLNRKNYLRPGQQLKIYLPTTGGA